MSANSEPLDGIGLHRMLHNACLAAGGQKAWAGKHGISARHVNDVLSARRSPTDALLRALGLARIVRYRPIQSADSRITP